MKLSFSDVEIVGMIVEAMEDGWNPIGKVLGTAIHSPQATVAMTIEVEPGVEIRFKREALELAVFQAVKMGKSPIKIDNPLLKSVTFHHSSDDYARVEIVDEEVESRFGGSDEDEDEDN